MKFLPALLLVVLSVSASVAQKRGMVPGYVVKTPNDTLFGFIRERSDWTEPYVDFAQGIDGETTRIPTGKLKMFYLKPYNSYFYKSIVDIDKKPRLPYALDNTPGRRIVRDTLLLNLVVGGTVTLFKYTDENTKKHFFIQKNKETIQELDYVQYREPVQSMFVEMKYYVETLRAILSDCDKVKTTSVRYDENSLSKVVREYNSCFSTTAYTGEETGNRVRVGVFAGAGPTSYKFPGQDMKSSQDADAPTSKFSNTTNMFAGLNVEFVSKRALARAIPGFHVMYQKVGSSTASHENLVTKVDLTASNFAFFHAGANLKFILNPRNSVKFYLKGAFSLALVMDSQTTYISTNKYTNVISKPQPFALPKKAGFAASGAAGVSFGPLDAEIGYMGNMVATEVSPTVRISNPYIALGFRFVN